MTTARALFSWLDRARLRLAEAWARARLRAEGVALAPGVRLLGVPVASRADGSSIDLGARVVLCSSSRWTALGVAHPVVLRTLRPGARIAIAEDTGLSGATVCAAVEVTIGRRCLVGADAMIVDTDFHPLAAQGRRHAGAAEAIAAAPVRIDDDVFIGARACVLKGVAIGRGAVVGCGAIVTTDVPAGAIVAGNPARVIGHVPGGPSPVADGGA